MTQPLVESDVQAPPGIGSPGLVERAPVVVRVSSHVAVWVTVLVSLGVQLSHGWRPVGDNAAIASRAFQTFTAHPPVLGMLSTASGNGHTVYDPGPLLFWLLAIPVHLDATHGALWGAALIAGATLSLAVEAAWSTRLWPSCAVIAFVVVDMFWLTPSVFENIVWNAYFPIPFFIAALVLAWVVCGGSFGWWPALVFIGSVAGQSHLLFPIPCTVLVLLAPVVGVILHGRPARLRWLWMGFGVAIACWIAPILQQLFGRNGNVSALFGSQSGEHKLGFGFALSVLGRVGHLPPIWLTRQPTNIFTLGDFENTAKAATGIVVLVLLAATAAWALWAKRRYLAAATIVSLVTSTAVVVAIAIVPYAKALSLFYLLDLFWPLGIMIWATLIWGAAALVTSIWRSRATNSLVDLTPATDPTNAARWQWAAALVSVAAITVVCILGISGASVFTPMENSVSWDGYDATSIVNISRAIERAVPPGPVAFAVTRGSRTVISALWISEGVGWQLKSDGWSPGLDHLEAIGTGLELPSGTEYVAVVVTMEGTRVSSISTANCRTTIKRCINLR